MGAGCWLGLGGVAGLSSCAIIHNPCSFSTHAHIIQFSMVICNIAYNYTYMPLLNNVIITPHVKNY